MELRKTHRFSFAGFVAGGLLMLTLGAIGMMLLTWPFRYRESHPLLEKMFNSKITVGRFHRIYFPHPGYIAEDLTFYRQGNTTVPPLAKIDRMTVDDTWTALLFRPHELYEIRLNGLHIQIPPPGTTARRTDIFSGSLKPSEEKIAVETIIADGTTLALLQSEGRSPLLFRIPAIQIHNVRRGQPMEFSARVMIPAPPGTVAVNGMIGPFRSGAYAQTPMEGTYSVLRADLSHFRGLHGHAAAAGRFRGILSGLQVMGTLAVPDFRAGSGHTVRLDAGYRVTVEGKTGDVQIQSGSLIVGKSVLSFNGSVSGSPKKLAATIAAQGARVDELLDVVEHSAPSVTGRVSFRANVQLGAGPQRFLDRLHLTGKFSLDRIRFIKPESQHAMDTFSSRVRKPQPKDVANAPEEVWAEASSQTTFSQGTAYFPDVQIGLPGATAQLHGTMNLINTEIHFDGKVAMQQDLSHVATGARAWLLKPLDPLFRHQNAGALVSIAVTGTTANPKIQQNILHTK